MAKVRLTVTKNVSSLILRIHILVQPCTVVYECILKLKADCVLLPWLQQLFVLNTDSMALKGQIIFFHQVIIHFDIRDMPALKVKKHVVDFVFRELEISGYLSQKGIFVLWN